MANIWANGDFLPYKTDTQKLTITKGRTEHKCSMCRESIPSGSFHLGKNAGWWNDSRICLNCADSFLETFVNSVEAFKQLGIEVQENLKENKDKFEAQNISAKI